MDIGYESLQQRNHQVGRFFDKVIVRLKRGFAPCSMAFESWYSALANLKSAYGAASNLTFTMNKRETPVDQILMIEMYRRGLKQWCGVKRCACHKAIALRNHIGWAIRAFLRLKHHRIITGTSWFERKLTIIRLAIQQFLPGPKARLRGFDQARLAHKRATA